MNAWVAERGGSLLFGGRRIMGIGLPLLHVLSTTELQAVLAHEFGHYHGSDTRLGPWIYQTRAAIGRTLQQLRQSVLAVPIRWYGNWFVRVTHGISCEQEYAGGRPGRGDGRRRAPGQQLDHHGARGPGFPSFCNSEMTWALEAGFRPGLLGGVARFSAATHVSEAVEKGLPEATQRRSKPYDTHPSLRERMTAARALGGRRHVKEAPPVISLVDRVDRIVVIQERAPTCHSLRG